MRNYLFTLAVGAMFASASSQSASGAIPTVSDAPKVLSSFKASGAISAPKALTLPSWHAPWRSYENPELSLTATEAVSYDYRDLRPGCNAYQLILTNCDMDGKNPSSPGQLLDVVVFGPADNKELPSAGTYEYNLDFDYPGGFVFGSNVAEYVDVFPHPENPEEGLVAYYYNLTGGTIEIAEDNGIYTINARLTGEDAYADEPTEEEITVTYTGVIEYADPNPYEPYDPLEGDVVLENLTPSGRYTDGDYNIAFYNVELDPDGFVIGPGNLMATEIFVSPEPTMNLDDLCGTFTPIDAINDGMSSGYFWQGTWMQYWGMWLSLGTYLTVYQDDMSTLTGLATGGTITISRDGDTFTVVFDLTTPEDNRITGTWSGPLAQYITDLSSGIDDVLTDAADENVEYYDLRGVRVMNPVAGQLMIVRKGDKVSKTIIR